MLGLGQVRQTESLKGEPAPRAAFEGRRRGPNPFAQRAWLRRLHVFIGERLDGAARWEGWELVAAAQAGVLDRTQQRVIDQLDKKMRACDFRPTA
jgi:hypothetical protein